MPLHRRLPRQTVCRCPNKNLPKEWVRDLKNACTNLLCRFCQLPRKWLAKLIKSAVCRWVLQTPRLELLTAKRASPAYFSCHIIQLLPCSTVKNLDFILEIQYSYKYRHLLPVPCHISSHRSSYAPELIFPSARSIIGRYDSISFE